MSKKKSTKYKKAAKNIKKINKRSPKAFAIALVAVLIVGIIVTIVVIVLSQKPKGGESSSSIKTSVSSEIISAQSMDPSKSGIQIHFMELGNKFTGDSTYIKAGDVDILIDAGSRQNSATAITQYVNQYCTDGKLEYVIATHAHQDHIAGFVGSKANPGIFNNYKIDTLIDFSRTDSTSTLYSNYVSLRDEKITSGDIVKHYTAQDCIDEKDGAKKTYQIADGITMEILDQKFYREKSSDENNYSVCAMFTQGSLHYLFTGDLEEKGEESLVNLNHLPTVELFKGGHHGSYTANTDTLLSVIRPKVVCVCCCAGSTEYTTNPDNTFPAQAMINRVAKYTEQIYVTTLANNSKDGYESLNGNIVFSSADGQRYDVNCSNNNTILKETNWFKNNRSWPGVT